MRIQRLSPNVANQIAAGEVIERPASVVKELLENALDAGATTIHIELGFGGLNLIKISDNGQGIYADDLPLAIAAHATSKIAQLSDLYTIKTMGFRGEALASIASVSKISIYSKPADQAHGMLLRQEDSEVHLQPFARTQGTTIEVRDLFFNIPVRKSFLKSERLEYQAIECVVKQFAMAAPEITISLQHNQKQTLHLLKAECEQTRMRRIKKLFGQAFLNDAILIQEEHAEFSMQGWISQREYQRSQRDKQWVYLNNRLIKDKLVLQAIGQAYQDILHPGRYPSCILYLTIPPDQVDVNVHPTKHEVRFRDPRMVHARIVSGLANYLVQQPMVSQQQDKSVSASTAYGLEPTIDFGIDDTNDNWLILNQNFALVRWQNTVPCLIDIAKIYRQYISHMLQTLECPFPQRALLVPIRIAIEPSAYSRLEQQRPLLLNLGLQFDFISTQHILLRTMPLSLPLLDLQQFFMMIQKANYEQNELIQQLIACQEIDAYNISTIERQTLHDYCMQHWDLLFKIQACMRLDLRTCQHLMTYSALESV